MRRNKRDSYLKVSCSFFTSSAAVGVKAWFFRQMINISAFGASFNGRKVISCNHIRFFEVVPEPVR